jgi:hypothetical protein
VTTPDEQEQATDVVDVGEPVTPDVPLEAPEADAVEQAADVVDVDEDEDDRRA